MSSSIAVGDIPAGDIPAGRKAPRPLGVDAGARDRGHSADLRRWLQLGLAALWLLDGVLQFQAFMFTRGFPRMLAGTAQGNPAVVAGPITWSARIIDHHLVLTNALFATIQLLLGLGIAWRPTVKAALGASVAWALAVWWLGEGFGAALAGGASPVDGAPGAVVSYALLAVLLWPTARDQVMPFPASRAVGVTTARVLWLIMWGSLAYSALLPVSRAPQALSGVISDMAVGQPPWLAWTDQHLAAVLAHRGLAASIVLAAVLAIVAVAVFLPGPAQRPVLVLAVVVAAVLWVAQGLGGIFTGAATDPSTAPLLALLALAYWPSPAIPATGG